MRSGRRSFQGAKIEVEVRVSIKHTVMRAGWQNRPAPVPFGISRRGYTVQMPTACLSEANASGLAGMNSCATCPVYFEATIARMIAG